MPDTTRTTPTDATQPVPGVKTYLRATLKDGTQLVSEFTRLANVQKYAAQVFARVNVFNAWQIVSRVHPTSGEPCIVRRRRMISGEMIAEIEKVVPRAYDEYAADFARRNVDVPTRDMFDARVAALDAHAFEPAVDVQAGQYGSWVAPVENTPTGAVAGMRYPIHRDPTTLDRFVILRVAQGDEPQVIYSLEADRAVSEATIDDLTGGRVVDERRARGPADGDDDLDGFDDGL